MKLLQVFFAIALFLPITIVQANTELLISGESVESYVAEGAQKQYKIVALAGQTVTGVLDQLSADADLRMHIGSPAGIHSFDCKSTNGGQQTDSCSLLLENNADIYISVHGYRAANYRLTVTAPSLVNEPLITSPSSGNTLSGSEQTFALDNNGIDFTYWYLRVGSSLGANDIANKFTAGSSSSLTISGLPIDGSSVYVRLRYKENGIWKTAGDYTYTASSAENDPFISSPISGSTLSGATQTFLLDNNGINFTHWYLRVGSSLGDNDIANRFSAGSASSLTISGLPIDGSSVHVRLRYKENGVWKTARDYTYTAKTSKVYPPNTLFTPIDEVFVAKPNDTLSHYIDTAFNDDVTRTVTRITNRKRDQKGANSHPYPKQGAVWNKDMTLLKLDRRIYDAETFEEIELTRGESGGEADRLMERPKSGSAGSRWAKESPNDLYVMSGDNSFYRLTLSNDRKTISKELIYNLNLTGVSNFTLGHGEGNIDYADKYVVLSATQGDEIYSVLLDIKEKQIVWGPSLLPYTRSEFDWTTISPSGNYIVTSSGGHIDLYHASTLEFIKTLAMTGGHGDIGYNQQGQEIYLQLEINGNEYQEHGIYGYILNDSAQREAGQKLLDSNYGGGHVSCRNYELGGWCYISTKKPRYREVFALKLDGSKTVRRFAQTHARGSEHPRLGTVDQYYYAEYPFGVVSPDGTRVLFWSDFGNPDHELYYEKLYDNLGNSYWETKPAYYQRDTYEVRISR